MTIRLRGATGRILALGVVCLLAGVGAAASDVEAMRAATVKITVEHGAGDAVGSGILLCQSQGRGRSGWAAPRARPAPGDRTTSAATG